MMNSLKNVHPQDPQLIHPEECSAQKLNVEWERFPWALKSTFKLGMALCLEIVF